MADTPWWSNLISTALGSAITLIANFLADLRKRRAAESQRRIEKQERETDEVRNQERFWKQRADELLVLKAEMFMVHNQADLYAALQHIGTFLRSNPALLRVPDNHGFFVSYCSPSILNDLSPSEPGRKHVTGDDFTSQLSGALDDMAKLVVPPPNQITKLEESDRRAVSS